MLPCRACRQIAAEPVTIWSPACAYTTYITSQTDFAIAHTHPDASFKAGGRSLGLLASGAVATDNPLSSATARHASGGDRSQYSMVPCEVAPMAVHACWCCRQAANNLPNSGCSEHHTPLMYECNKRNDVLNVHARANCDGRSGKSASPQQGGCCYRAVLEVATPLEDCQPACWLAGLHVLDMSDCHKQMA